MRTIKHILVVVDPTSEVQHCVQKGARLARAFGAVLELFVCDYESGLLPSSRLPRDVTQSILKERRARIDSQLRSLVEPLRLAGLQVSADYSFQEQLHSGVVRKVRLCGADLVLKDTHYHGAIERTLFTNSDWHLIRECPVPLLLTKPAGWHPRMRVAAALDPGHADDKPATLDHELVEIAEQFATAVGGDALAVHAFEVNPLLAGMIPVANGIGVAPCVEVGVIDSLRKYHEQAFEAVLAGHPACEGRSIMIEGAPSTVIPAYAAREEVDVLVTGAVSRSPMRRLLVGSTAERLLDRLPCDILIVKPMRGAHESQPAGDH